MLEELSFDSRARFDDSLSGLVPEDARIGVAVSGGPDSLALLVLAAAARPKLVEAATVDHGLRPGSVEEAAAVAATCRTLGVPHTTLQVAVAPGASLQAQARKARYDALARWAAERCLPVLLTAHHADDQAETLLMRLSRGAGLSGLSGIRPSRPLRPDVLLARPLLDWRKAELAAIVQAAQLATVDDPANRDPRHDRTRARSLLAEQSWLDPQRLAASAAHLREGQEALEFVARGLFHDRCRKTIHGVELDASDLPRDLQRRLLLLGFEALGTGAPRGPELDRALEALREGRTCTLGGLKLAGGAGWQLSPAPPRR